MQTAITIFVAEFVASQNAEEKTLQVVSVAGPRHATHLNDQVLGDLALFHRLLLWGTQDRGRKLEVTIIMPGEAPLKVSQCLSCVAESEGRRYCTPMAVQYPDAKRRFTFEFTADVVVCKMEWSEDRTKGNTRLRTASRPRSSLLLRKRARPKKEEKAPRPCKNSTKYLADVVFPDPGGPTRSI